MKKPPRDQRLAALRDHHQRQCGGIAIPGQDGFFVTADGRVFTVLWGRGVRPAPVELTTTLNRGGYVCVRLKGVHKPVHRLVARTFLGPCPDGQQVRHLDGDPTNPQLTNLVYGTARENTADRFTHGTVLVGEQAPTARFTDAQVSEAVELYRTTALSQREVGERFGTSQQVICRWVKAADLPRRYPPRGHPTISGPKVARRAA